MASRTLLSRASRIKSKLQSSLEASMVEVEDVSYQHAGHVAVKEMGGANETHFNVNIVSQKFDGQSLVKRHRMVYDLLSDELHSEYHLDPLNPPSPPPPPTPISVIDRRTKFCEPSSALTMDMTMMMEKLVKSSMLDSYRGFSDGGIDALYSFISFLL